MKALVSGHLQVLSSNSSRVLGFSGSKFLSIIKDLNFDFLSFLKFCFSTGFFDLIKLLGKFFFDLNFKDRFNLWAHRLNLSLKFRSKKNLPSNFIKSKNPVEKQNLRKDRKSKFKSLIIDKNFEPENPKTLEELDESTCKWPLTSAFI